MIIWSIVLRGNNVKRSSRNNCGTHAIEGEKKMLVRMASGTIEEKIKRTKEGSQHRLSFLTGGVSVHNLCICYYFVFFISEMSLNHTWAIPLTLKNDLFAENTEKNLFSKYRRYSKLKVRCLILFENVKTPRYSAYEIPDDRDSQPWSQCIVSFNLVETL